jgi:hypothetical protein
MEFVFIYVVLTIAVGVTASSRGRSGVRWALLALVISPLIAVLIVAFIPRPGIDLR